MKFNLINIMVFYVKDGNEEMQKADKKTFKIKIGKKSKIGKKTKSRKKAKKKKAKK